MIPTTASATLTFQQSAILIESLQALTKENDDIELPSAIGSCVKEFVKAQAKFVNEINNYMHDRHSYIIEDKDTILTIIESCPHVLAMKTCLNETIPIRRAAWSKDASTCAITGRNRS
jgi:hypothetical protein